MSLKNVFLLGATGYIGGSVLTGILAAHPDFSVTALVRKEQDFEAVRAAGVANVTEGSHGDLDKIQELASKADIVVNAGDADDLPLTKAILAGLRSRSKTGDTAKPILIHTSGSGVISDEPNGEFPESAQKIWNDNNEEDIRNIPPENPHRLIDLEIFQADQQGYLSAYIIAPSTIYGPGSGPVNRLTQQVPTLTRAAIKHKQAVHVGPGRNRWNNVHINDLVDLYTIILELALSRKNAGSSPYTRFYFASVHEHVWGDIVRQIGQILYNKGILPTPKPQSVTLKEEPGFFFVANNSRSASDRGFALGWKPKSKSIEETLEEDVTATLVKL